jgi:hypothetical protein
VVGVQDSAAQADFSFLATPIRQAVPISAAGRSGMSLAFLALSWAAENRWRLGRSRLSEVGLPLHSRSATWDNAFEMTQRTLAASNSPGLTRSGIRRSRFPIA